jgi:hypothetical protein
MKIAFFYPVIMALGAAPLTVAAEDFSWGELIFQPRVYAGYADYKLESGDMTYIVEGGPTLTQPLEFDRNRNSKIKVNGPISGLGVTVAIGRFFGDIYYQSMLNETAYSSGEQLDESDPNYPPLLDQWGDVDAQHSDWAFSLGYRVTDQWSIFAGYKSGKTDWDQSVRTSEVPDFLIQEGSFAVKFEQDGPFLGTSYSFLIGSGALTIKAAYAYLDGSYASNYNGVCIPCGVDPVPVRQNFSWDGDSDAFSFGVSWTQPLMDNLGLSVGANYHRYKFDASGSKQFASTLGDEVMFQGQLEGGNLTEELFTLTASLLYTF